MKFHINQSPEAHYTVYKLTSPSGKIYIGCTGMRPKRRWQNGKGYIRNTVLNSDITTFGWDAFTKEILCEKLIKEGAEAIEKRLIEVLDTRNPEKGYNVYTGGAHRGAKISTEGAARYSKAIKAAYQKDPSLRKRISIAMIEMYAENPDHAAAISSTCKKTRSDPAYRAKMSARAKDYYARTGISPHKPAIPVKCIETGEVYSSMTKAEKATGVNQRSISYVCNGIKYSAGGLHWKFANPLHEKNGIKNDRSQRAVQT